MTTHLQTSIYGLVTKPWIFSRCGSRIQPATEPIHGEAITTLPFAQKGIGRPTQESHLPKWGEPLDVLADCGHVIKVPHAIILAGEMIPCYKCAKQETNRVLRKQATIQRQAERRLQQWIDKNQAAWYEMKRRKR